MGVMELSSLKKTIISGYYAAGPPQTQEKPELFSVTLDDLNREPGDHPQFISLYTQSKTC